MEKRENQLGRVEEKSNQRGTIPRGSKRQCKNLEKRHAVVMEVITLKTMADHVGHRANKLIVHFSHPHPLRLFQSHEKPGVICNGCDLELLGMAYCCTKCNFHLHESCSKATRELAHGSHPEHTLKLLAKAPYSSGGFLCSGCSQYGKGFTYHCFCSNFDLHVDCAHLPKIVKRDDHEHKITLSYSSSCESSNKEYCHVCLSTVDKRCWLYSCIECNYWCHFDCVFAEAECKKVEEDHEETDDDMPIIIKVQGLKMK
ncbi:hypothetical protein Ancab_025396 [Ancistrocladus abbreviatus]